MLKVVGAGLGRTGTNSLKLALEQLLGGRCYHMFELTQRDMGLKEPPKLEHIYDFSLLDEIAKR